MTLHVIITMVTYCAGLNWFRTPKWFNLWLSEIFCLSQRMQESIYLKALITNIGFFFHCPSGPGPRFFERLRCQVLLDCCFVGQQKPKSPREQQRRLECISKRSSQWEEMPVLLHLPAEVATPFQLPQELHTVLEDNPQIPHPGILGFWIPGEEELWATV